MIEGFLTTKQASAKSRIGTMDEGERAELVKLLVDRVTVHEDRYQITMALERAGGITNASPGRRGSLPSSGRWPTSQR